MPAISFEQKHAVRQRGVFVSVADGDLIAVETVQALVVGHRHVPQTDQPHPQTDEEQQRIDRVLNPR